ncbi:MAG: nucleotide-binding universal stress UspA family protein [Arenicella sp.]|jgi:nucleotide-binding universal stress UspA family protein
MYNDLTVCVNNITYHNDAVLAALKAAQRYNCRLHATYIKRDAQQVVAWQGLGPIYMPNELLVDRDKPEKTDRAAFEQLASNYDCELIWRTVAESDQPIQEMLCTDIIFIQQPQVDENDYHQKRSFLNNLILESKRPILMIPKNWQQDLFAAKVLFGWDGSAEAMRAASDALPILKESELVIVTQVLTKHISTRESDRADRFHEYLVNKNIVNKMLLDDCETNSEIPTTLIKRAADEAADLIVIGGYGHSRLREVVMGGMTDQLIKESPIPVFFSH